MKKTCSTYFRQIKIEYSFLIVRTPKKEHTFYIIKLSKNGKEETFMSVGLTQILFIHSYFVPTLFILNHVSSKLMSTNSFKVWIGKLM